MEISVSDSYRDEFDIVEDISKRVQFSLRGLALYFQLRLQEGFQASVRRYEVPVDDIRMSHVGGGKPGLEQRVDGVLFDGISHIDHGCDYPAGQGGSQCKEKNSLLRIEGGWKMAE